MKVKVWDILGSEDDGKVSQYYLVVILFISTRKLLSIVLRINVIFRKPVLLQFLLPKQVPLTMLGFLLVGQKS
jgi:hypothetical protein